MNSSRVSKSYNLIVAKTLIILGYLVHTASIISLFICAIISEKIMQTLYSSGTEFESSSSGEFLPPLNPTSIMDIFSTWFNWILAVLLCGEVCYIIMYALLDSGIKKRNHLLMLPAMFHIGTSALTMIFYTMLSYFHLLTGMQNSFVAFASLLITIPLVTFYKSLHSLYFEMYNGNNLRENSSVSINRPKNIAYVPFELPEYSISH